MVRYSIYLPFLLAHSVAAQAAIFTFNQFPVETVYIGMNPTHVPAADAPSATSPPLLWLRYLAPVLLSVLIILLDQLSGILPFIGDFSVVTMLGVAVAPLAELYYLWQRPRHLRYPLLLSICLLGFHGALGLTYWLHAGQAAALTLLPGMRMDALAALLLSGSALMVLLVYWLRSLHKQPQRWVDWVKLGLATVFFATFVFDYLLRNWLPTLLPPHTPIRIWIGMALIASAGLFWLFHLIEEMALPARQEASPYEALIDEIQSHED